MDEIKTLAQYPGWTALQRIAQEFVDARYNFREMELTGIHRLSIEAETAARIFAAQDMEAFLSKIGILTVPEKKVRRTFE